MKDRNHTEDIERLRQSGRFTLDGRITDEEHLAAFLDTPRAALFRDLFHPGDRDGLPYLQIGRRHVFTVDALKAYLDQHASPETTSRKPKRKSGRAKRGAT